ncbi:MAG: hypothetical protein OXU50_05090 [Gammaproteobacteria bacterium]|nr:hypothetical protein [Gammaproteobacteria bacterium]
MNDKSQVVKHLEMIQGVVNRLGHDSFLMKGWSMTILAAGIIFVARSEIQADEVIIAFLIPVFGFWILDGYFLWQERLFRKVYDEIRKQEITDFAMNVMKHKDKPKCSWRSSIFSVTLNIFYGIEILFVFAVFLILKNFGSS